MNNIKNQSPRLLFFISLLLAIELFSIQVKAGEIDYLKPNSTFIIIPDKPDGMEIKSSALLNKWLNKIYQSDSGFHVVRESMIKNTEMGIFITLGKTKFTISENFNEQQPYSFLIRRKKNIVSIFGATPLGTLFATTYFLDHYCGVRFYLPGDLFTAVPDRNRVGLNTTISINETPFTKYLFSTGYKNSDESNWAQNNALLRKDFESHQHSMGQRFFDDSIIKLFPEIFPLVNGKRYIPKSKQDQGWEPDFAEPKLVDAAVYATIKYFKNNPQYDYISFSVQDSRTYPTEGKMGDFLKNYPSDEEGKKRGYTDAFITFLNKLAQRLEKELPANGITKPKTIIYLVYGYVRVVPSVKLNPNILPVTVFHISGSLMDGLTSKDGVLKDWSKVTKRIGNHDWAEGMGFIYPRIYTDLLSQFLKAIQNDSMQFEFAHLEMYPNWALDGPKNYFMAKLYWNPNMNTDSLLSLFCKDMFGKAGGQMKVYFSTLENLSTSMDNNRQILRGIRAYLTQLPLNENELSLVQHARQSIDKAYSQAVTDDQRKRIELFSNGFKISEGFFDIYNSKTLDTAKVNGLKDYLKNTVSGNQMMLNIATDKNFLTVMDNLIDQIVKGKK